jgi:hypothetical protein
MKKSAILLMLAGLWWACNSIPSPAGENAPGDNRHDHAVALTLNNGQKWRADMSTNENVASLCTIARDFAGETHTGLTDYETLGSGLQKGFDKMIRECRMEGAGHDALHLWLEPLLVNMNELKKADNTASAGKIFAAIHERLELYTQYFE